MSKELAVQSEKSAIVIAGAKDLQQAKQSQTLLNNFIASQMIKDVDYGVIPGTGKKSLYKPGAEKILFFNGLGFRLVCIERIQDWEKGFFHYEFKAVIFHKATGTEVGECSGSANSLENKYRYRWVSEKKIPRGLDKNELVSEDRDGKHGKYTAYRIDNEDKFTLANNLLKMAQKRALIGGALSTCRASENFTQDLEEEDAHKGPEKAKNVTPANPASEGEDTTGRASEKQIKRLRAIMIKSKVTEESLKPYLVKNLSYIVDKEGKAHLSWIKWQEYEGVCKHVEWMGEQAPT